MEGHAYLHHPHLASFFDFYQHPEEEIKSILGKITEMESELQTAYDLWETLDEVVMTTTPK